MRCVLWFGCCECAHPWDFHSPREREAWYGGGGRGDGGDVNVNWYLWRGKHHDFSFNEKRNRTSKYVHKTQFSIEIHSISRGKEFEEPFMNDTIPLVVFNQEIKRNEQKTRRIKRTLWDQLVDLIYSILCVLLCGDYSLHTRLFHSHPHTQQQ